MRYFYRAFGLVMASELELPQLSRIDDDVSPDLEILRGRVPENLENPLKNGVRFQIKPGHLLMRMDGIAGFYVTGGSRVVVESEPGSTEADIRVFLLGSVLGAVMHQRKLLPLHGSAIRVKESCVIFCGQSGSGKSTTANALVRRGYTMHTDDMCVISKGQNGRPIAFPGYPGFKLWEDSLLKLGDDPETYPRLRTSLKKYAVPVSGEFNSEPLPIKKIYLLSPHNKSEIDIRLVTGNEKFNALLGQTYKFKFLKFMGTTETFFKTAIHVGEHVPMARVNRPIRPFLLDPLADLLEKDFKR